LYWNESPNKFWGGLLVASGEIPGVGHEDPQLRQLWHNLLDHTNVSYLTSWSAARSPETYLDALNRKGM